MTEVPSSSPAKPFPELPTNLVEFAKQRLSAVKYPREVRIVDAIPLTSVLKTDRKRLRAELLAETAS